MVRLLRPRLYLANIWTPIYRKRAIIIHAPHVLLYFVSLVLASYTCENLLEAYSVLHQGLNILLCLEQYKLSKIHTKSDRYHDNKIEIWASSQLRTHGLGEVIDLRPNSRIHKSAKGMHASNLNILLCIKIAIL